MLRHWRMCCEPSLYVRNVARADPGSLHFIEKGLFQNAVWFRSATGSWYLCPIKLDVIVRVRIGHAETGKGSDRMEARTLVTQVLIMNHVTRRFRDCPRIRDAWC